MIIKIKADEFGTYTVLKDGEEFAVQLSHEHALHTRNSLLNEKMEVIYEKSTGINH